MSIIPDNNSAPQVSGQELAVSGQEAPSTSPQSSDRFAILARKEKAMRDRVRQIEEQERGFKEKERQYQDQYIPKEKLLKDPLAALSELGLSYDKITEQALNQQNPFEASVRSMKEEIAQLKSMLEGNQKAQQEQQNTQYQNAIKQINYDVGQLVESNPDFELIKEMKAQDQVVGLIEEIYKSEGRVLSVAEAAKEVENYLYENALKTARLGKISKALMPKEEVVAPKPAAAPQPTLTHNKTVAPSQPTSDKDRIARAIAAFQNVSR